MSKLRIYIDNTYGSYGIYLNDKRVKPNNNVIEYEGENDVFLEIKTLNNFLLVKGFIIIELFFFLISVFGIFDSKDKSYYILDFKTHLSLNSDRNLRMKVLRPQGNNCAIKFDDLSVSNETNVYVFSAKLKRRARVLKFLKLVLVVIIALITFFIIKEAL